MSKYYLINSIKPAAGSRLGPGDLVDDVQQDLHRLVSAGGVLVPASAVGITEAAASAIAARQRGDSNMAAAIMANAYTVIENRVSLAGTPAPGVVAKNVVRIVSAGVYGNAQANSVAAATYVVGIWDGTQVVPFDAQPIAAFDSPPIVGLPCYLSATVAGALTSAIPAVGAVSVPVDLMVAEDKSDSTGYAARVCINKSTTGAYSSQSEFKRYAAQLTGLNLAKSEFVGSDFTASDLQDTGTGPMLPLTFGSWTQPCELSSQYSCIYANPVGTLGFVKKVLPAANLATQRWAMSVRWRQDVATYDMTFALRRATTDGITFTECAQFGYSAFIGYSNLLVFGAGNYDPYFAPWTNFLPSTAGYGTVGVTWHQGVMYSKGDGNIYCNLDNTGVLSLPIAPSAATGMAELLLNLNSDHVDWIYLVTERVDY